jgi:hypothetical protein
MAAFYREHDRAVFAHILLVTGERITGDGLCRHRQRFRPRDVHRRPDSRVDFWHDARHRAPRQPGPTAHWRRRFRPGPGGDALSARAVAVVSQLQSGAHTKVSVEVKNCSAHSLVEALGTISTAAVSGP